jgi:SAM-dependent methyltransferase
LLDVGCGDGEFLSRARERGWAVSGAEIDRRAVRRAVEARGLTGVRLVDVRDGLAGCGEGFDAVTAFDLVEHLPDPVALVSEMAARARPGGGVVVAVPRLDRSPAVFDEVVDRPPHHLTLWTPAALGRLMESAGLVDIRVVERPLSHDDVLNTYVWARRRSPRGFQKDLAYYSRNVGWRLGVAALRLVGTARGHTLLASGRAPPS